jgi:hypothetical protein
MAQCIVQENIQGGTSIYINGILAAQIERIPLEEKHHGYWRSIVYLENNSTVVLGPFISEYLASILTMRIMAKHHTITEWQSLQHKKTILPFGLHYFLQ